MNIPVSHLPTFCRALEDALREDKLWLGFDERIQQLSAYDLHFFDLVYRAQDFQLFNHTQEREVILLPTEAVLGYIQESVRSNQKEGIQFSHIEMDDLRILEYYSELLYSRSYAKVEQLMDTHDWAAVTYDPLKISNTSMTVEEQILHNRMQYTLERISGLALHSEKGLMAATALVERHWKGTAMESHMQDILNGKYAHTNTDSLFNHKNNVMNAENMDYLQNQLKFLGFGEGLSEQLEKNLKEGLPDFQMKASHTFGKDEMEAVLYFKRSERDEKEFYFFNKYDATLKQEGREMSQTFYINNKGQSITFKESCNLLNGRAVFKELSPKEGEKYKAWVKLDFSEREQSGNAKVKHFHENFGYDVKEAVARIPLKELTDPDKMQTLVASLEKGNLASVTLLKDGNEKAVLITADPQYKTLKMFDTDGKKLYVPAEKPDQRYGLAPADERKLEGSLQVNVGDALGEKKPDLLPVNDEVKHNVGQKIN